MEANNQKLNVITDHVISVPARGAEYGYATTLDAAILYGPKGTSPTVGQEFRFYFGELTGLLFVIMSSLYILMVPKSLARRGEVSGFMKRLVKRSIDIVGALVGIVLTAPIMLALAAIIKIDSRGPVFYSQTRVGINRRRSGRRLGTTMASSDRRSRDRRRDDLHGLPFSIIKFRTMVADAEKASGPVWASKNDARITRVGRILRKARLDEIPQFFSVLVGNMSLVGPRPERPVFVSDLSTKIDNYSNRLKVKPGITGLAQIENGYDSSLQSVSRKVKYDLHYIRHWSVFYDLRILAKTVIVVFTGKGAC